MAMHDTEHGENLGGSTFTHNNADQMNADASRWQDQVSSTGNEAFQKAKEFLAWGNARHVVVRRHGEPIVQFPLTVGIIATVFAPQLVAIGVIAAILTGGSIEIQHEGMGK